MDIRNKFNTTNKNYNLITAGERIVVAVSGGPDSLALLFMLNSLKEKMGLSLYVAHLNHGLRKQAKDDLLFVGNVAKKLNLPFMADEVNIARLAKKGSIEELAREERLKFLFKVAKKFRADKIALGHTKDDQAETVLMRILRGTGLYGLRGILPKREIDGFTLIRPLIEIERSQIDAFLKRLKIKPRLDVSNLQNLYFRNKIRNRLMPELKKYNRNIKEILSDMAQNVGFDYDYLYNASLPVLKEVKIKSSPRQIWIKLDKFLKLHPAIQKMILRIAIRELVGSMRRLNFKHWKELEDLILRRPAGSVVDLPRQIKVLKTKGQIRITLRKT